MKLRPSPSGVIAVVALVLALGGTAIAADLFTEEEKKQIETIAVKAFDERIGGASVKHAASADTATTATTATRAGTAGDTERLGGQPASAYQRTIQGGCTTPGSAIATISPQGQVGCTAAPGVQAIRMHPQYGESKAVSLGDGLVVEIACRPTNREIRYANFSGGHAPFNFSVLRPGSTEIRGMNMPPSTLHVEAFGPRFSGQYSFMTLRSVTSVNLHGVDTGKACEVSGTAVTAVG